MKTKLILSIIILCSWTLQHNHHELKKAEWLIGTWENKTPKGSLYETWTKKNDTELLGKSYYLKDKDTVLFENIRLVEKERKLYYIVPTEHQNDKLPVSFTSTSVSDTGSMIFENLQHDFPQVISYTKIDEKSLIAEISATKNGKKHNQTFPMKKIK
ncbi:DUF6265 family protein [Chryseobacterium tongliaoense]|uniref:DUF6265 family protein n=1 Tax=Chryseobacterium tongliaoense TaxID=3240933 RepID=UPI0035157FCE